MEQRTKAQQLRRDATPAERLLWQHLSARKVAGTRFNRQVPIGPYVCDFVARSVGLVIEVDGGQHGWQDDKDATRTRYLEGLGYTVIRFWNHDVTERTAGVVQRIETVLATLPSPNPSRKREGSE